MLSFNAWRWLVTIANRVSGVCVCLAVKLSSGASSLVLRMTFTTGRLVVNSIVLVCYCILSAAFLVAKYLLAQFQERNKSSCEGCGIVMLLKTWVNNRSFAWFFIKNALLWNGHDAAQCTKSYVGFTMREDLDQLKCTLFILWTYCPIHEGVYVIFCTKWMNPASRLRQWLLLLVTMIHHFNMLRKTSFFTIRNF